MEIALHEGQYRIWNEINEAKEKGARYFIINCPRQWGKTHLFRTMITELATNGERPYKMMWVSQYLKNARKIHNELLDMVEGTSFFKKSNKTDSYIQFQNGSIIYFAGADNTKSIRGYSNEILFMDEFAHYSNLEENWNKVLRPTTLAFKERAKIFMISTPNGKNTFWDFAVKGQDVSNNIYSYHNGNYAENPFVDTDEIENARNDMADEAFRQEYLAEFIDWDSSVFRHLNDACVIESFLPPRYGESYYAGVDWGRQNDETVLTIINIHCEVVYIWASVPNMGYDEILNKIILDLKRYRIKHGFIETNTTGDVLFDVVKKQIRNVDGFHTNNDRKRNIIEALQLSFDNKELKLPTQKCYPKLINQLGYFTRDMTPHGKITYRSPYGKKDDHVMSLAFAYHSFKQNVNTGQYVFA